MITHRIRQASQSGGRAARRGRKLKRRIRRFAAARDGNIAIMFVFMLGALMLFAGGAVDFTRYNMVRADLIESMDAAGLAMAQIDALNGPEIRDLPPEEREAYLKEQGRKFFFENFKHASWVEDLSVDFELTSSTIVPKATGRMRTLFLRIGEMLNSGGDRFTYLDLDTETEIVRRDDGNIEVAMVMDVTGSMGGSRIADLKDAAKEMIDIVVRDDQSEWYSKAALIPYSMGVNVGAYANQARGPIAPPVQITNISRENLSSPINISDIYKYNPARVDTSGSHGFSNGDVVCIEGVNSSGSGSNKLERQVNDHAFVVSSYDHNTFRLTGINGGSWSGSYQSGGSVRKCRIVVTAPSHGFSTGDYVHITDVSGMSGINNDTSNSCSDDNSDNVCDGKVWRITRLDNDKFSLDEPMGVEYANYTSGGFAWCTTPGCQYYLFARASDGKKKVFPVTGCVSERIGAQAYTDAAPSTAYVGRLYKGSENTCPSSEIVPLSTDKSALKSSIDNYVATGSTAGQIGIAWGWYLVSPNFGYLFPEESRPAPYTDDETTKVVVIMTDGEFNTPYCNGVIAKDARSGSGSSSNHINCNATNGDPYDQAQDLCTAMKNEGVIVYTIGFDISSSQDVTDLLTNCASGPDYVYFAATGDELKEIYRAIGSEITKLHISR